MPSALRPYVTAGVALVGASVISVTPISPAQIMSANSDPRVSSASVDLVASVTSCAGAASTTDVCATEFPSFVADGTPSAFQAAADVAGASIFNIPANLLIALANVPYNFLTALGTGDDGTGNPLNLGSEPNSGFSFIPSLNNITLTQPNGSVVGLTSDLNYAGNIWVYSPTNVLGTDPGDIARYQALVNLSIPFPALSVGLGNILAAIAASQLPMNSGCTGTGLGACPNIGGILGSSLNLGNIFELFSPQGYTFPEVRNPITCNATGQCDILNPAGPLAPQSGQTVALDLFAPFTNFYNSLTETPDFTKIRIPTIEMAVNTLVGVIAGFNTFLNPFVLGTQCGICALVVPNPDNLPIPGPTNPGTTPIIGPATGSTTLVSALGAPEGQAELSSEGEEASGFTALARSSQADVADVVEPTEETKPAEETTPTEETKPAEETTPTVETTDETTGTEKTTDDTTDKTTDTDKSTDADTDKSTDADTDKSTSTEKAADTEKSTGGKHRKPSDESAGATSKTGGSTEGGESGAGASNG